MSYEARRDDLTKEEKRARDDAANQKAVQVGVEVASNSGHPVVAGVARGIKTADTISGGEVSKLGGKVTTGANKFAPFAQGITNAVANNKVADKAYDAYNAKKGKGAAKAKEEAEKAKKAKEEAEKAKKAKEDADKAKNAREEAEKAKKAREEANRTQGGGEQEDSLPSSSDEKEKKSSKISGFFVGGGIIPIVIAASPFLLVFVFIIVIISTVTNFADYEDAFGISQVAGADTGGVDGGVSDPDQSAFYTRIIDVQNSFQAEGKTFDPLMVVSVYHALNLYEASITYKDMSTGRINQIANAMFDENVYSEEMFKANLKIDIIPMYLPHVDSTTKDSIVNEVFDYVDRYYSIIGKDTKNECSSTGTCTYDIKGFYINGSNYKKSINVNDLYVRLMQCGSYNGHNAGGHWGKPLEGEELIPFEKYILGVAYQEIGPSAPKEAIKAQMIAARSYILARPTQMNDSWHKLQQENGKWVLQVASCTADQVYCDPDKGCSAVNGDAQWKQVYSGTNHGVKIKGPLSESSPLRKYAAEVQGETLINKQGNIVLTDYTDVETQKFIKLANSGLDYKQIIMQVYTKKYPNANISNISKASCGSCVSDSSYAKWKQYSGEWVNVKIGNSGKTIKQIGCLVTSLSIQVAKSGVKTNITNLNPGTFVQYLNSKGAFDRNGALLSYDSVSYVAPSFRYQGYVDVNGMNKQEKLNTIKGIVNQQGVYAVAEVKGNTGQHWVAIDSINGDIINMMDPGSNATSMWKEYNWVNTSRIVYYKVS